MSRLRSIGKPLGYSIRSLATVARPIENLAGLKMPLSRFDPDDFVDYNKLDRNIEIIRSRLRRPLTYAEKVLYSHIDNAEEADIRRGESYVKIRPARIACQDATAQMALIQFMSAGIDTVAVPTTVHCDHLVIAKDGAHTDVDTANEVNREVYDFLQSVCKRYKCGFWKPGAVGVPLIVLHFMHLSLIFCTGHHSSDSS